MARLDSTGRVREQAVFDALGWHPGQRLTLATSDEVIVFVADPRGGHRVDQRGATAGEMTGLYYSNYTGSTSVLRGATFGRIAGAGAGAAQLGTPNRHPGGLR